MADKYALEHLHATVREMFKKPNEWAYELNTGEGWGCRCGYGPGDGSHHCVLGKVQDALFNLEHPALPCAECGSTSFHCPHRSR